MPSLAFRFFACVIAVPVCAYYLPGVHMVDIYSGLLAGGILGIIHLLLRPLVLLMVSAFNLLTLGLLSVIVDTWLVLLVAKLLPNNITIDSFWWALACALFINIARELLGNMFANR